MKATGIVRRIDALGRIVLPKELRRTMNLATNEELEIYTEEDKIILAKYIPSCMFCGGTNDLMDYNDKPICAECRKKIAEL